MNFENSRKFNLAYLADFIGLLAAGLCFVHCWLLPVLLIFLPGLLAYNEWVHPALCSLAILSTMPVLYNKTFRHQSRFLQFALVLGNVMMLLILLTHDQLPFMGELVLNTIGGVSLIIVHYNNLRRWNLRCLCEKR